MSGVRTWTDSQWSAIRHVGGDLLVSAAAGSGKTAVLSERCARLVTHEDPRFRTSVDKLLVLTFTEAAANEMRERIGKALREKIESGSEGFTYENRREMVRQLAMLDRASISTLHAFCADILRSYFHEVDAGGADKGPEKKAIDPDFGILDEDEARLLRDEVMAELLRWWHQEGIGRNAQDADLFSIFLEDYAQGDERRLAGMIFRLDVMLQTVADPKRWIDEAVGRVSGEKVKETLADYVAMVADELRIYAERCGRNREQLAGREGYEIIHTNVSGLEETLRVACEKLREDPRRWDEMAGLLGSFKAARMANALKLEDFNAVKKAMFVDVQDKVQDVFLNGYFNPHQTYRRMLMDIELLREPLGTLISLTLAFQEAYRSAKYQENRLDFSDLERLTLGVLTKLDSAVSQALQKKYDHILVDEFQDTNPLQAALLQAVRSPEKFGGTGNLFVVGDVKQSIYGFRLADPALFLAMEKERSACGTHRAFIGLQHNFRTRPALLASMNVIFERLLTPPVAGIDYRRGHALEPPPAADAKAMGASGTIELHLVMEAEEKASSENSDIQSDNSDSHQDEDSITLIEKEAAMVAEKIRRMLDEKVMIREKGGDSRPIRQRDITILLRGVKNKAPVFVRMLRERGIDVHADLSTGYFDAVEVREMLALLRVVDNPRQDIPLAAVMLSRMFAFACFSYDDLARIRLAFLNRREVPFHLAAAEFSSLEHAESAGGSLGSRLKIFWEKIAAYRQWMTTLPLHEALSKIYEDSQMFAFLAGNGEEQEAERRSANLRALHLRARQFSNFRRQGLYRFLRFIEQLQDLEADAGEASVLSEAADVVRILSIHKSKGLEFPVVFVCALGSAFHHDADGPVWIHRQAYVGMELADAERNVFIKTPCSLLSKAVARRENRAEELRLLYVAMTRARERLILTGGSHQLTLKKIETLRTQWKNWRGELPEDALLAGRCYLDVLLPLCVSGDFPVVWDESRDGADERQKDTAVVRVFVHAEAFSPGEKTTSSVEMTPSIPVVENNEQVIAAMDRRIRSDYRYAADTRLPAMMTVTELKRRAFAEEEESAASRWFDAENPFLFADVDSFKNTRHEKTSTEEALNRGIATHRVLELLDFSKFYDGETLEGWIKKWVHEKLMEPAQAACADIPAVLWFLESDLGRRLHELAATDAPAGKVGKTQEKKHPVQAGLWDQAEASVQRAPIRICRELAFTYSLPVRDVNRQMVSEEVISMQGMLDVLVVLPEALEIIDYKTDQRITEQSWREYTRQLQLYAKAVHAILKRPVKKISIVFLTLREIREVSCADHE